MNLNPRWLISIVPLIALSALLLCSVILGNILAALSHALLYFDRTDAPKWVHSWLDWIDGGE